MAAAIPGLATIYVGGAGLLSLGYLDGIAAVAPRLGQDNVINGSLVIPHVLRTEGTCH